MLSHPYIYIVPRIIQVEDTKFLGVSFNFGVYLQAHRWLLGLGIRFNAYMKRDVRPTILSYCENNPPSVSHQNSMCTLDKSDLPDSPNRFLFNKRKFGIPAYGMVGYSECIPVVVYVHASSFKIIGASKYASTMMHEYATTSI